jgi:hypothetical protein
VKFFDREFLKKFPELSIRIKKARKDWYKANGEAKEFIFKAVSGSIAFT